MKRVMISRRNILKGLVYSGVAALAGVPSARVCPGHYAADQKEPICWRSASMASTVL